MTNHRAAFTVPGFASKEVAALGLKGAGKLQEVTVVSGRRGNGGKTGAGGMAGVAS